jgi:outer membrane protein assembly factor BamB
MRVTNGIPFGWPFFLPVHTVNCVQTLKVGSWDTYFYSIATRTGKLDWKFTPPSADEIHSSFAVAADGSTIFVGDSNNIL